MDPRERKEILGQWGTREENLGECLEIAARELADVAAGNLRPNELARAKENLKGRIVLSMESRADTGHQLFHINAGGGLACASCHPEGGEDGRVWKFACQGERRTQSIRGAISGTALSQPLISLTPG